MMITKARTSAPKNREGRFPFFYLRCTAVLFQCSSHFGTEEVRIPKMAAFRMLCGSLVCNVCACQATWRPSAVNERGLCGHAAVVSL